MERSFMMEKNISIKNQNYSYEISAVLNIPDSINNSGFPAVILCHGTGSHKDEVGDMFVHLSKILAKKGIASIRFDFAGCGDSSAQQQDLTFYGEVSDTEKVYNYLCQHQSIKSNNIGILGFSQGARVMAEFLGNHSEEIKVAVSLSGACHNGEGVFQGWFKEYYDEINKKGYAKIPMLWRDDLILSKEWFDEIQESSPMDELSHYTGAILAVSGTEDVLVPYEHAQEIVNACRKSAVQKTQVIEDADHTFNILEEDKHYANDVVNDVTEWIEKYIS